MRKYLCEFIGTAVLVLFGCGTAAITGGSLLVTALALRSGSDLYTIWDRGCWRLRILRLLCSEKG